MSDQSDFEAMINDLEASEARIVAKLQAEWSSGKRRDPSREPTQAEIKRFIKETDINVVKK
jgi:hypothetical protein